MGNIIKVTGSNVSDKIERISRALKAKESYLLSFDVPQTVSSCSCRV